MIAKLCVISLMAIMRVLQVPKKRRKLNKEFEEQIENVKRYIELVTAKINDIDEEERESIKEEAKQLLIDQIMISANNATVH